MYSLSHSCNQCVVMTNSSWESFIISVRWDFKTQLPDDWQFSVFEPLVIITHLLKLISQTGHLCGLSSEWLDSWRFRSPLLLKHWVHSLHWNGRSLEWVFSWAFNSLMIAKLQSQSWHLNGFSLRCLRLMWRWRPRGVWQILPHVSQVNSPIGWGLSQMFLIPWNGSLFFFFFFFFFFDFLSESPSPFLACRSKTSLRTSLSIRITWDQSGSPLGPDLGMYANTADASPPTVSPVAGLAGVGRDSLAWAAKRNNAAEAPPPDDDDSDWLVPCSAGKGIVCEVEGSCLDTSCP